MSGSKKVPQISHINASPVPEKVHQRKDAVIMRLRNLLEKKNLEKIMSQKQSIDNGDCKKDLDVRREIDENERRELKEYCKAVAKNNRPSERGVNNRERQRDEILCYVSPPKPDETENFDDYFRELRTYANETNEEEECPQTSFVSRREITEGSYPNYTVDLKSLSRLHRYFNIFTRLESIFLLETKHRQRGLQKRFRCSTRNRRK